MSTSTTSNKERSITVNTNVLIHENGSKSFSQNYNIKIASETSDDNSNIVPSKTSLTNSYTKSQVTSIKKTGRAGFKRSNQQANTKATIKSNSDNFYPACMKQNLLKNDNKGRSSFVEKKITTAELNSTPKTYNCKDFVENENLLCIQKVEILKKIEPPLLVSDTSTDVIFNEAQLKIQKELTELINQELELNILELKNQVALLNKIKMEKLLSINKKEES
ncbi:hypothetical protein HDU92_009189 [Lobulomyces angularis]|nr:hypothetical protein HDU92_009189 [Lobulomyces angularis]